jgi:hypothetical protein
MIHNASPVLQHFTRKWWKVVVVGIPAYTAAEEKLIGQ